MPEPASTTGPAASAPPLRQLRVCALYPDLMNIYADRGNLIVLERRCAWRGIGFQLCSSGLGEPLVDQLFGPRDDGCLEGQAGFGFDPKQHVGEGQPGKALGNFGDVDLVAGFRQHFGFDTGRDDFRIDEHAVAIEDDEIWLGHGNPM